MVRDKGRELEPDPELDEFCFVFELLPDKPRNIKRKIRGGSLWMRKKTQTEKKANFKKINGKEVSWKVQKGTGYKDQRLRQKQR